MRQRWRSLRSVALASAAAVQALGGGLSTHSPVVLAANATTNATAPVVENVSTGDNERLPCLGFLLPDLDSVIISARCANTSQSPLRVALIGVDRVPWVVTVASFVADDRYHDVGDDAGAFDAVVGSLTAPVAHLDASPVVFDSLNPMLFEQQRLVRYRLSRTVEPVKLSSANGSSETDVGDLDGMIVLMQAEIRVVASSECEAISGKRLPQSGVLCGKSEWSSADGCQASSTGEVDNQLVTVITQGDAEYAFGIAAQSFPCSASDNSTLFVITSVVDLQLASSVGSTASASSRSSGSGSLDSVLSPTDPSPPSSGSSGSSTTDGFLSVMAEPGPLVGGSLSSVSGSVISSPTNQTESPSISSATSAADDAELIPDKVFAASVRYPFAYLSDSMNASMKSVAAFQIFPMLLVVNADWITDRKQIKWVLFEDDKISVKRLWFHSESTTWFNSPNYIVVVELARAYKRQGVRPTSLPLEDATFAPTSLQLSFLDPILLQSGVFSDDNARLASVDVCGLNQIDAAQEELSCLTSSPQTINSSATVQMGFVLYDGKLAGLVSGSHTPNGDKMIARFLQLAQDRRRDFLLSVFVESYRSREVPPEASRYLASAVQFFNDGLPVGCGGIVIAPDAVLTTATCALSNQLSESCLFDYGADEYSCTILEGKPLIHPLYEADTVRYNFAIISLSNFFPASAVIALTPFDFLVGSEVVRVDLSSQSGAESCVAVERGQCASSQTSPAVTVFDDLVCAARANTSQAESISSSSSALIGTYHGKPVLLGLQLSPEEENLPVQSYSSVVEAKEFIYANVYGIAESSSTSDEDVATTIIPDEVFSASVRYPFAYLSDSMNVSTKSVAAVHITSTLLVANADWISDREQIKWVLFEDDKIPVKKLSFHSERKRSAFPSSSFIVMIELARGYKRRGVRPVSLPQEDGGFESTVTVQLSFLDPVLLQSGISSDANAQLAPLDACGLSEKAADNEGLSCVTSAHQNASTSTAVRMGFVMYEGKLAGIVSGYHPDALKGRFMLLMQIDRRDFMFDIFVDFYRSAELTPEESKYRASAVWFFENQVPVECGGVLISPDAILTTASCASQNQLLTCLYGDYDCTARTDKPLLHPLYEADAVRYNFAIVKLVNFLPSSATISLASVNFPIESEVVHVDLSNPSEVEMCVMADTEQCGDPWSTSSIASATLSEMVCAMQTNGSDVEITSSSSAALVGSHHNKTVLLGLQSVPDVESSAQSYSNIANAKEFIYANVYGLADASGVNTDGEDTAIPDDVASVALRYPFAYLSSSMNVSTKSVAAFHISPRFVVVNADWIDDKEQVKWVLLEDDKIPVKKLWAQSVEAWNMYPAASFIVMIELERAYYRPGFQPVSLPLDHGLELSFLDPVLLQSGVSSDASAQLAPVEECGLSDIGVADQEGLSCLTSTRQNASTSLVAVQMGFVLDGGKLVGLTSGFHMLSADVLRVRFLLLSEVNRRNFMLNVFVESHWSGETTPEESEYIRPTVQFFDDGFPVDCGGMVVAPDAVLTTASCALAHHFSSIAVMTESGSLVLDIQPQIVVHQLYQAENKVTHRYNFAIVKLISSLPESAVVALAPSEMSVGSEVVRVDLSGPAGAEAYTVLDTEACVVSKSALSSTSDLLQAAGGTICAGNANGDSLKTTIDSAALLGTIEDTLVLVGLLTEHGSNPSTDSYASVLLDAVEFINANVYGRRWGSESPEPDEISDEVLQSSLEYPFAYLLSDVDVPADPVAAVQISPTIVLANAEWIQDGLEPKWVLFKDDKILVKKIQYETDFQVAMGLQSGKNSSSNLMLIKLERPYVYDESRMNSLSLLPADSQNSLEVKQLDSILLRRGLPQVVSSSIDSSSACSPTEAAAISQGRDCVHLSLQNVTIRTRGTLVQMGFLVNDGAVVGLWTGARNLAEEMSVPFARLDFEPRKAFIDTMTSLWSQDAKPTLEEMNYRGAAVQLIAFGKILDCGGMLIAPEFVLTTASCVQGHEITAALCGMGQDAAFVGIFRNETVVHPLYQSGDTSMLRYNLAIIKLSSPQPASAPIALTPFEEPIGSDVVRVDLSGGTQVASYRVLEMSKCSSSAFIHTPGDVLSGGIICAGNETVATENPTSTSAALHGSFNGKLVLVGLQVGPDANPHTDSYVDILGAANFINAYVYGHIWGRPTVGSPARLNGALGFVVGLRMKKTGQNFCGGALIASQYVLTAAHCVSDGLVTWASIGYDAPNKSTRSEEIQVLADRIRIHPKFGTPNMYSFDAAILELKTPAYHLPIPLDSITEFVDGASSELISFGAATKSRAESPELHELELSLWSHKKCQAVIPDVDTSALCAGGEEAKDACTGESGSPLTLSTDRHEYSLIGLVSAGYGCGQTGVPGLYTRISSVLDFIAAYTTPVSSTPIASPQTDTPPMPTTPALSATPVKTTPSPSPSTSARGSGSNGTGSSSPITPGSKQSETGKTTNVDEEFPDAIEHQPLPDMTDIAKGKVDQFLLGTTDPLPLSTELRNLLTNPTNEVTLYSTGDLSGLLRVIAAHDALPLNQREDRFGSVSDRRVGKQPIPTKDVCR